MKSVACFLALLALLALLTPHETIMRKFYRLLDDVHIPLRWHLHDPMSDKGCADWEFRTGRSLAFDAFNAVGATLVVDVDVPGAPLDFTLTNGAVPIASPRLVDSIASLCAKDVQRIAVRLGTREGYEVINATRIIRCLDESKSEYIKWTEQDGRPDRLGQYRSVPRLRVDASHVPEEVNLFRVWGWNIALIVSQPVVDAFRRVNATGAVFKPAFDEQP